ncbi:antirestriction protein ArdA [Sphingomonas sanguinis]|uniref:antirestriction protein ArdA n=1 Tax=Sphingomonas sp. LC-1 TaxID=3110957 RepID=UPI0021BAE628|nr:antirestriction protein ArdA [Sphingomonas sp. LC-1]MCT8003828.1 antirestriction protein ArdA [Sphingomonas sp. LC-1]
MVVEPKTSRTARALVKGDKHPEGRGHRKAAYRQRLHYEGFEGVSISEYAGIDSVARMAAFIAEHGALGAGLLGHFGGDMDQAETAFQDCYHGQYASLADYMEELTSESVTIPEALRYYVDWQAMARDAEIGGDLFTIETAHGEVHVFSSR